MATQAELKPLIGTPTAAKVNGDPVRMILFAVGDEVATIKVMSRDGITYKHPEIVRLNKIDLYGGLDKPESCGTLESN